MLSSRLLGFAVAISTIMAACVSNWRTGLLTSQIEFYSFSSSVLILYCSNACTCILICKDKEGLLTAAHVRKLRCVACLKARRDCFNPPQAGAVRSTYQRDLTITLADFSNNIVHCLASRKPRNLLHWNQISIGAFQKLSFFRTPLFHKAV